MMNKTRSEKTQETLQMIVSGKRMVEGEEIIISDAEKQEMLFMNMAISLAAIVDRLDSMTERLDTIEHEVMNR